jgi:hypothetical protein
MADRRNRQREEQNTELLLRVGHDTFHARLKNVSDGGAYFETPYLFDPTTELRLAIEVPGRGTVSTIARPMRFEVGKDYRVGVAVCFVEAITS